MTTPIPAPASSLRRTTRTAAAVLLLAAAACAPSPPTGSAWTPVDPAALADDERPRRERALAARDAMFTSLLGALGGALRDGGPAGAITVCRDEAPRIAERTGREHGVSIGRTARKLRNPANAPPPWAAAAIASGEESERAFRAPDGALGVLLPIRIAPPCLACHGSRADIAPDVLAAIDRAYPADTATGFASGDLRGWFWVEVPPR